MHVIFDSRDLSNLILSLTLPLLPLGMSIWGFARLHAISRRGAVPTGSAKAFAFGTLGIFVFAAWLCWWSAWRVENDYAAGRTRSVEGTVTEYSASPDGKSVSLLLGGVHFDISCCDPRPVYRGTPTSGLSPELLREGMPLRVTYLDTDEIVRIETSATVSR